MKNFFKTVKNKVIGIANSIKDKAREFMARIRAVQIQAALILSACRGENFVDSGIKILIAVVIGALLLGGLYALFGATGCCIVNAQGAARTPPNKALTKILILPTVTQKVNDMFNFNG